MIVQMKLLYSWSDQTIKRDESNMTSMLQCNINLIFARCLQDRKLRYQSNATLQKREKSAQSSCQIVEVGSIWSTITTIKGWLVYQGYNLMRWRLYFREIRAFPPSSKNNGFRCRIVGGATHLPLLDYFVRNFLLIMQCTRGQNFTHFT